MIYSLISKKEIKAKADGREYVILSLLSPTGQVAEVFTNKEKFESLKLPEQAFNVSSLTKVDIDFSHKGNIDSCVLVK